MEHNSMQYTFYAPNDNLWQGDRTLLNQAYNWDAGIREAVSQQSQITSTLYAMAKAEASREKALITEHLGKLGDFVFKKKWGTVVAVQELINIINEAMKNKERLITALGSLLDVNKRGKTQVGFFDSYFQTAYNARRAEIPKMIKEVLDQYVGGENSDNCQQALQSMLDEFIKECIEDGLKRMLLGKGYKGTRAESLQGYSDIWTWLNNTQYLKILVENTYKAYGFGRFSNIILDYYNESKTKNFIFFSGKKLYNEITIAENTRSSAMDEWMMAAIGKMTTDSLSKVSNVESVVSHMGGKGFRPDETIIIGAGAELAMNEINKIHHTNRAEDVEKMNKATQAAIQQLQDLDGSFIIYVSNKMYFSNTIEGRGYEGARDVNLNAVEATLGNVVPNIKSLIRGLMQLGKGAIGEGKEAEYSNYLASQIAYFLFDDYDTIGAQMTSGTSVIHLMSLNGMLIPISAILFALAKAIESVRTKPSTVVKVSIKAPPTLWDSDQKIKEFLNTNGGLGKDATGFNAAWNYQAAVTREETVLTFKFLQNIRGFLKKYVEG